VVRRCQELGFLINCTVDTVLRFVPPLIVSEAEIDRLIRALDTAFSEM
jgi:acetylornithine/succinyldiaminopimelate/putrescine aminotransferase